MLSNPFYIGYIRRKGIVVEEKNLPTLVKAEHKPIIKLMTFSKISEENIRHIKEIRKGGKK